LLQTFRQKANQFFILKDVNYKKALRLFESHPNLKSEKPDFIQPAEELSIIECNNQSLANLTNHRFHYKNEN
jgi:hypothetical protein